MLLPSGRLETSGRLRCVKDKMTKKKCVRYKPEGKNIFACQDKALKNT